MIYLQRNFFYHFIRKIASENKMYKLNLNKRKMSALLEFEIWYLIQIYLKT